MMKKTLHCSLFLFFILLTVQANAYIVPDGGGPRSQRICACTGVAGGFDLIGHFFENKSDCLSIESVYDAENLCVGIDIPPQNRLPAQSPKIPIALLSCSITNQNSWSFTRSNGRPVQIYPTKQDCLNAEDSFASTHYGYLSENHK